MIPSRKNIGGYYFEGYVDRPEAGNKEALVKCAVFTLPGEQHKPYYVSEPQIRAVLREVERAANSGVEEGRTIRDLFSAVHRHIPVQSSVLRSRIKPQDLYMLLDGMYDEQVVAIDPPDLSKD